MQPVPPECRADDLPAVALLANESYRLAELAAYFKNLTEHEANTLAAHQCECRAWSFAICAAWLRTHLK